PSMIALYEHAVQSRPEHRNLSVADQFATAAMATAYTIKTALSFIEGWPDEVIVSGGGTRNGAIMLHLRKALRGEWHTPLREKLNRADREQIDLLSVDELGARSEAKEAIAFALLGAATLDGTPSNVPSATGAHRPVVLGSITPRP